MHENGTILCATVAQMRQSDRQTIERYVPSLTLMYRAAMGVYRAWDWSGETVIAAGGGNNGGNGFALACILRENGRRCRVVTLSDKLSPDSAHFAARARALGVPVSAYAPGAFAGCDTVVDCLLGTGFRGGVREPTAAAIREINAAAARVVSVDINSGMDGDTGAAPCAVRSDLTVTIGMVKRGQMCDSAGQYITRLVCADIGIVPTGEEERLDASACPPYVAAEPIDVRDVTYREERT